VRWKVVYVYKPGRDAMLLVRTIDIAAAVCGCEAAEWPATGPHHHTHTPMYIGIYIQQHII
jgi:hypothetical protein